MTILLSEFGFADDMDEDIDCPVCGATVGQQCSIPDDNNPGMSIEMGAYVHIERLPPYATTTKK